MKLLIGSLRNNFLDRHVVFESLHLCFQSSDSGYLVSMMEYFTLTVYQTFKVMHMRTLFTIRLTCLD